jgi:hypothetical protein
MHNTIKADIRAWCIIWRWDGARQILRFLWFVIFILLLLDVPCSSQDKNGQKYEFFELVHFLILLWIKKFHWASWMMEYSTFYFWNCWFQWTLECRSCKCLMHSLKENSLDCIVIIPMIDFNDLYNIQVVIA